MKRIIILGIIVLGYVNVEAQELDYFILQAELNNPEIQAFEIQYKVASEKLNEVNAVSDTEFRFGYFVSEPETRTGAQIFRVTVRQMIPWFGTISARQNYTTSLAAYEYLDFIIAKRKLGLSVSQSYYRLNSLRAKQEVLQENIILLKTYERLALTSLEVGSATAVDVLRLQIRQNEVEQLYQILEEEYLAERSLLNNLLNRDVNTALVVQDEMVIPDEARQQSDSALALNPELIKFDKVYESVIQSELLNKKEAGPKIGFGLDFIAVEERPDMVFSDNGKDIFMPMISLSVPIFNKGYNSKTIQNELKLEEIRAQKDQRLNILETMLAQAQGYRNSARIEFVTQSKNLRQAEEAQKILMKSYETGTIDFNDVLDIQELQLKFQTNLINSTELYYVQSAIINYLTS
ncbi:MAG: TolC family protein [Flavobacteriaceae bacterium]